MTTTETTPETTPDAAALVAEARGYLVRNVLTPHKAEALADLMGVCTQVDHITASMSATLAAREALLEKAREAIDNAMLSPVHGIVDKVLYTRIAMSKPHYESVRALAAEIAAALKGQDNG
jgi:hypothetical protein